VDGTGPILPQVERLKFTNTIASAILPQLAIAEFLRNSGTTTICEAPAGYAQQVKLMTEAIGKYFPRAHGSRDRPAVSCCGWNCRKASTHWTCIVARWKHRISTTPGPLFSPKSLQELRASQLRHPWSERMEQAVATLGRLADKSRRCDRFR